jgi:DNA polymerase III subunit epsilon
MIKTYTAFDLETTGLSPEDNEIIEIGALKVRDGKVAGRFIEFLKPKDSISSQIQQITGITDAMVADARPTKAVINEFVEFCEDDVLIGHNILFDFKFMKISAGLFGLKFEKQGIDTLNIAKAVHQDFPSRSLGFLCEQYGIVNDRAHRAYHDALATAKIYQTMGHYYEQDNPDLFKPKPLSYKVKKAQSITGRQKTYLNQLLKYYKIEYNNHIGELTRSEASRLIDSIISTNGRMI